MPIALIIYASLTGNTHAIAEGVASQLQKQGVQTVIQECQQAEAKDFLQYDICLVGTYTYGSQGDLPDEIYYLYEDLEKLRLDRKVYGVFGSGEVFYNYFCKSVDDFDNRFQKTGAIRGAEPLKIEEDPKREDEAKIAAFAQELLTTYQKVNL